MGLFRKRHKNEDAEQQPEERSSGLPASVLETTSHDDWRDDKVVLELLARFFRGADPWKFIGKDHWTDVLGDKVEVVIERLKENGALMQAPLALKLATRYSATDLQFHLGERGLSREGDREALIHRLIQEDAQTARQLASEINVLILSDDARGHVIRYVKAERERREAAERKSLVGLLQRNYLRASVEVGEFQQDSVFSRGVGAAFEDDDHSENVKMLQAMFEKTPVILEYLDANVLDKLRPAAGMAFLWGTESPERWIDKDIQLTGKHDAVVCCAMLRSHARFLRERHHYRSSQHETFEIWTTRDDDACPACVALRGQLFRIDSVPELPHEHCSSPQGCRCRIVVSEGGF